MLSYVTTFMVNSCSRKKTLIKGRQAERKKKTGRSHTGWSGAGDGELSGQSEIQVSRRREQKRGKKPENG